MKMSSTICFLAVLCLLGSCSRQSGEPSPVQESVSVSPETVSVGAEGGSVSLKVTASGGFEAYTRDAWINDVQPGYSPAKNGDVTFTVGPNEEEKEREGSVVVKCGTTRKNVSVKQAAAAQSEIPVPDGYTLVWQDEFDGTSVSSTNWRFENWAPGRVNNELQRYVAGGELDGNKTAYVANGVLYITAQKYKNQVISARMNTNKSWTYGYMEASIWLPKGKGTWPAFWMMPDNQSDGWPTCGEIDIMEEVGCVPNEVSSSIHTKSYNHTINTQKTAKKTLSGAESGFHTYALEWTPEYIRSYVDGKDLLYFKNDGKKDKNTWPFNKAFYITLNLAWGGDWGGMWGVDESALPTTMRVDYVRVFQKKK